MAMNTGSRQPEVAATGFAVIYRWRLIPGREDDFREAWAEVTRSIILERGGLGSRLHRADDGTWMAYAQWRDRACWEAARAMPSAHPAASAAMAGCIEERLPTILLEPVADLLVQMAAGAHGA